MDLVSNTHLIIGQSAGNFSKNMTERKDFCNSYITSLKTLNTLKKQGKKDFSWYKKEIKNLFKISETPKISVRYKTFLGGVVAGEGSINVSAKKRPNARFGFTIDPEFSITQHIDNFFFLFAALLLFQTGRFDFKNKRDGTFVYKIDNRKSIKEKVIPFWETYVLPFQDCKGRERIKGFKKLIFMLEEKNHTNLSLFTNEILPLWDKLRLQKGQKNDSFPNLQAARDFAIRKGSSETLRDLI